MGRALYLQVTSITIVENVIAKLSPHTHGFYV